VSLVNQKVFFVSKIFRIAEKSKAAVPFLFGQLSSASMEATNRGFFERMKENFFGSLVGRALRYDIVAFGIVAFYNL
jgi:hypothetical protein